MPALPWSYSSFLFRSTHAPVPGLAIARISGSSAVRRAQCTSISRFELSKQL